MSARLFTYGKLKRIATQPGTNHLPGTYFAAYGIQYGAGAWNNTANNTEPGEVVEIAASSDKGYTVKRATSSLTLNTAAIVVRDIMGVRTMTNGVLEEFVPGVPLTVIPATTPHGWSIVVPIVANETAAAGGAVYVGLGTNNTVLGGIYANAQGTNGADSIALTGWTFGGTKFAPTLNTSSYAVVIKKY
jgi:hypothetical protein